jgi:hypothetical protein
MDDECWKLRADRWKLIIAGCKPFRRATGAWGVREGAAPRIW